ncbi:MAG TPA: hypothetical protein VMB25_23480 [Bryobacteraceae bacterium]|nr:hypothetical protein [Bryobacteraceae bacterium]
MPFLHVGVYFDDDPEAPKRTAIEEVLNKAKDWFRYAPNCWLVYTARDATWWSDKLRSIPGMEDHNAFLVCQILLDERDKRAGWLKQSAWDWINKDRGTTGRYRSGDQK